VGSFAHAGRRIGVEIFRAREEVVFFRVHIFVYLDSNFPLALLIIVKKKNSQILTMNT
jgi:hypothetical protein